MDSSRKINPGSLLDLPPIAGAEGFSVSLKDRLDPDNLKKNLVSLAYESMNLSAVERPGQFSVRGGIVDIWLERYQNPVRIDFFGDRVEALYIFDPVLHRPVRNLRSVDIVRYLFTSGQKVKWPKEALDKFERLFLSDIKPGDLVVHIDHGIGRFLRIEEKNLEGKPRYYLIIEFAKGEKLYVPVQQIDRLSKYIGPKGFRPALSYLGTAAWERIKKRVKEDLVSVARDLLKIYAARENKKRPPYQLDTTWQDQLEADFQFQLTPSQEKALSEIKSDLESDQPMDRLLIGDVGFGKTELALRASFKVIQSGYQVMLLVPTAILAEQHYHTFKDRLAKFPVTVAHLSRFQTPAEQKEVLEGLKTQRIDIVIGTHRILSSDVQPKKLGLLVIDEEHRFGVLAKEKIKGVKADVDVLTLSATPIPRTLHLALAKLRDISLVTDPPTGRLSVQNFIGPGSPTLIKDALEREIGRGGQVYYLHNRINSIPGEVKKLTELIPKAKIASAHARMEDQELEQVMGKFLDGEIDVLICTVIIGSGLDIPNANTIVIKEAHKFGLADLYQLRGRVGRSNQQAYAYLLYPKGYIPKGNARDRLEAISESEELGSGFNLAEKDLEIRGAGNILGTQQHGAVSLVGFELYMQLLNEAVERMQKKNSF